MSCWGSEGGCQSLRTLFFNWKKRVEKKRAVARPAAEKNSRSYQRKYRSGIQVQTPASRPPSKFTCQYQKISRVATATTEITSSANVAAPLILYKGLDSDIRPAGSQGGLNGDERAIRTRQKLEQILFYTPACILRLGALGRGSYGLIRIRSGIMQEQEKARAGLFRRGGGGIIDTSRPARTLTQERELCYWQWNVEGSSTTLSGFASFSAFFLLVFQ